MVAALDPLRKVPCTISGCSSSFDTAEELHRHKVEEPDHFYCKKCRIDCESWEDLTKHKRDIMAPFLDESRTGQPKEGMPKPKHIVCEFCGIEFHTFQARKIHRETKHKAYYDVVCPGCSLIFDRAFRMIEHIEKDLCFEIPATDFGFNIQKKHISSELLASPDLLISDLDRLGRSSTTQGTASTIAHTRNASVATRSVAQSVASQRKPKARTPSDNVSTAAQDSDSEEEDGGIALMEFSDEESDATSDVPQTRQQLETWPRLPGLAPAQATKPLSSSFAKLSMATRLTANNNCSSSELNLKSDSRNDRPQTALPVAATTEKDNAWLHGMRPKTLINPLSLTPMKTMAVVKRASMDVSQPPQPFNLDFCNLKSSDYNPDRFFDRTIDKYICPFTSCIGIDFVDGGELSEHFRVSHAQERFPCPACLKVFEKPSAFISHFEMGNKCRIAQADDFEKLIDDYTGGILNAKSIPQMSIYRPSTDLADGVMKTQFTTNMPITAPREVRW